jgi:cell division cycle protein 20 (cofactor of APC complex)
MDLEIGHFKLMKENAPNTMSPTKANFNEKLAGELFDGQLQGKVLAFKSKPVPVAKEAQSQHKVLYSCNVQSQAKKTTRHISQKAERVLDAPHMLDDYYLNLVDWGNKNVLAIALSDTVYLWDAASGKIVDV